MLLRQSHLLSFLQNPPQRVARARSDCAGMRRRDKMRQHYPATPRVEPIVAQALRPMSLSFGGADAPSARGSQPRSSDLAELSRSRAGRPAQAKGPPHEQMPESEKTKWHWALSLQRRDSSRRAIARSHASASAKIPGNHLSTEPHALKFTRRDILKLSSAGALLPLRAVAQDEEPGMSELSGVRLEPFVDPLPLPRVLAPVAGTAGSPHYRITLSEFRQKVHRDLPRPFCGVSMEPRLAQPS